MLGRIGICNNVNECSKARRGESMRAPREMFICAECGKNLRPVPGSSRHVTAALAIAALAIIFIAALFFGKAWKTHVAARSAVQQTASLAPPTARKEHAVFSPPPPPRQGTAVPAAGSGAPVAGSAAGVPRSTGLQGPLPLARSTAATPVATSVTPPAATDGTPSPPAHRPSPRRGTRKPATTTEVEPLAVQQPQLPDTTGAAAAPPSATPAPPPASRSDEMEVTVGDRIDVLAAASDARLLRAMRLFHIPPDFQSLLAGKSLVVLAVIDQHGHASLLRVEEYPPGLSKALRGVLKREARLFVAGSVWRPMRGADGNGISSTVRLQIILRG
jgi:hypothetical protein